MKFQIKPLSEVNISSVFPAINTEIYELLENKIINLTSREVSDLKKTGSVLIGNVRIPESLLTQDTVSNFDSSIVNVAALIKKKMSATTLFMNELIDAICHGIDLKHDIMLFGVGGHNKSEGTLEVLRELAEQGIITKDKPFIKSLGDGTTVEDLFGGVKFKLMTEEGKIEYQVENSFMNHEIVIFEECFDAPAAVLLALKDIMTSRQFRNGNEIFDIKCKTIIALTNRTKEEISMDNSIEALAQRFSVTAKIEWPEKEYTTANFMKLFSMTRSAENANKYKNKLRMFAKMCEATIKEGNKFISPRSAVKGASLYCNGAPLSLIHDLDTKVVSDIIRDNSSDIAIEESEYQLNSIIEYCNKHNLFEAIPKAAMLLKLTKNNDAEVLKKNKILVTLQLLTSSTWHSTYESKVKDLCQRLEDVSKQIIL